MSSKNSFFRQSGWMVIATFVGGIFMTFVHRVAEPMGDQEYAAFNTLLRLLVICGIPAMALQTVFSQQMAACLAESDERSLSTSTRAVISAMGALGLLFCIALLLLLNPICKLFKIPNKMALILAILVIFTTLLGPIFKGLLQGQHRFASLGWLTILDGIGRFVLMFAMIGWLHLRAAGGMAAVVLAQASTLLIAAWLTRTIWMQKGSGSFNWRGWFKQILPLTVGIASVSFMTNTDMLFVQALFSDPVKRKLYSGAMMTGFAIVQFIAPVTGVMFPKIVQSMARGEKTDTLALTVKVTAGFGCLAAIGGTLLPELPLQILYHDPKMWEASSLVPWFAWGLLPLTVANVLVMNILARSQFAALPWLILVPAFYTGTLALISPMLVNAADPFTAFKIVISTMALFGLLLCGVSAWFTWGRKTSVSPVDQAQVAGR